MNIGLVIFNADPTRGGAERYTFDLAMGLAKKGHKVDLIAANFGTDPIAGVQFVALNANSVTRAGAYRRFLDTLDFHLAKKSYDIIHSMLPVRKCDVYHPHAGMAKASYATSFANRFNAKRRGYAKTEEALLNGSRKPIVLCLSDYVKASILQCYPDIGDRLQKLFNAVDLARFDPSSRFGNSVRKKFGIDANQTIGLMIAQHFEQKGLPQAMEAIAKIDAKNRPTLIVVGKDDPTRCTMQARQLGLARRVVFAGTTDSPADFYAAADFFVLPTSHDSCSLVVLEALAMGLPVISTVFNGACEIMTDGREGFVLKDPKDVSPLAEAIEQMLLPIPRESMRQAALALRPRLSFDAHLIRLEEIYDSARNQSAH